MLRASAPFLSAGRAGAVHLAVHVKPGARTEGVVWTNNDDLEIKSMAPPRDGEANTDVISQLSKALGVSKSMLSVVTGHKSRDKVVSAAISPDDVITQLARFKEERAS